MPLTGSFFSTSGLFETIHKPALMFLEYGSEPNGVEKNRGEMNGGCRMKRFPPF